jgi:hypothetical protein
VLQPYFPQLALELRGQEGDAVVDLIVTAHGSIDAFPLVPPLVAAAPALAHYRVQGFRARSAEPEFPIGMDGFELSSREVLVALQEDSGQVALELCFARAIAPAFEEHARHMAFIMLDHVLGEYDFAVKVGAVDFVRGPDAAEAGWVPLSALPSVFDAYWLHTLGRNGQFPAGEHVWTELDLEFNCAVDDEGNELDAWDLPEGETLEAEHGTVMVNTSANAVAMRADLAWALTLDVEAPDAAALRQAQEMQAQAATLLQGAQQGMGAWTLEREGRRQALFYVSDEASAREALAPLLAREGLGAVELKVVFDPAWSGYFEYAGYLA